MNVFVSELKHYAPGVPIILVGTKLSMFVYVYFDTGIVIHQMLLSCLFMIIYQFHFCLFVLQYEIYKLNPMGFMSGNYWLLILYNIFEIHLKNKKRQLIWNKKDYMFNRN